LLVCDARATCSFNKRCKNNGSLRLVTVTYLHKDKSWTSTLLQCWCTLLVCYKHSRCTYTTTMFIHKYTSFGKDGTKSCFRWKKFYRKHTVMWIIHCGCNWRSRWHGWQRTTGVSDSSFTASLRHPSPILSQRHLQSARHSLYAHDCYTYVEAYGNYWRHRLVDSS